MRIRVSDCVIDTDRRQVLRAGREVSISPKAFQLLVRLVEARPRALSKQQLHDALWPDTFVVEANLSNLIGEIRGALGDSRPPRIVRTLHGFGYAFAGGDESPGARPPLPGTPLCWLRYDLDEFPLRFGENIVGRGLDATVRLDASGVSRRHARIVIAGDGASIEDLGSKNGTWVRGARVAGSQPLADGDDVAIGPVRVVFRMALPGDANTDTI